MGANERVHYEIVKCKWVQNALELKLKGGSVFCIAFLTQTNWYCLNCLNLSNYCI